VSPRILIGTLLLPAEDLCTPHGQVVRPFYHPTQLVSSHHFLRHRQRRTLRNEDPYRGSQEHHSDPRRRIQRAQSQIVQSPQVELRALGVIYLRKTLSLGSSNDPVVPTTYPGIAQRIVPEDFLVLHLRHSTESFGFECHDLESGCLIHRIIEAHVRKCMQQRHSPTCILNLGIV
jgi:hypothetical protein